MAENREKLKKNRHTHTHAQNERGREREGERERERYPVKFHLTYSVIFRSAVGIESHHIGGTEIEKETKKKKNKHLNLTLFAKRQLRSRILKCFFASFN